LFRRKEMDDQQKTHIRLDNATVWPNPTDPKEIEWKLRYTRQLTDNERVLAACYIAAYKVLLRKTQKDSSSYIRMIKKRLKIEDIK
jgi:hypothetical protein